MRYSLFARPTHRFTREQARAADQKAVDAGMTGLMLMENASRQVAEQAIHTIRGTLLKRPEQANAVILCGGGNNGGDGFAAARHLRNAGANATAYALKAVDELDGDAAVNARVAHTLGLVAPMPDAGGDEGRAALRKALAEADVVIDALLGTGFSGEVREPMATLIQTVNDVHDDRGGALRTVAVDTPSGLDVDTGEPSNATLRADVTVTFVAEKKGFAEQAAKPFVGEVVVADIGFAP